MVRRPPAGLSFLLFFLAAPAFATPIAGTAGMVATAHSDASEAGREMLRAGGSACDAAVAAAFMLAVVEPYSSGLGGGGFALVRWHGKVTFLDFREVAPQAARADMFMHEGHADGLAARDSALGVAVPGAVAGYLELHKRCGKLPLAKVMAPAIKVAQEGFAVDLRYNGIAQSRLSALQKDPEAARIFLTPRKEGLLAPPPVGHRIVQPDLATTMLTIAHDVGASFYHGELAEKLSAGVQARGGIITTADFNLYKVRERPPLLGLYRGQAVATAPPPSAGGQVLLTLLNIMETQPPTIQWHDLPWLRLYIEGSKQAFADRALLGDPNSVANSSQDLVSLLSKHRARALAARFLQTVVPANQVVPGAGTALAGNPNDVLTPEAGTHTTHLAVLDSQENAVSLTTTVNFAWGAAMVAPGTGVLMNDEMDDFAIAVGVPNAYRIVGSAANAIAAGKVPLSSMTPTMVFAGPTTDSPLRLVVGSPGGSRIPTTVAQVIMGVVDHKADVRFAVGLPRLHHQHLPDVVDVEPFALEPATAQALKGLGYTLLEDGHWCNAMAIELDTNSGLHTGAADPRGVGVALAQ